MKSSIEMEETKKKKRLSKKSATILLSAVLVLCAAIVLTLGTLTSIALYKNNKLRAQEAEIVEKYEEIAKQHENLSDPDYASIYFDGANIYIPNKDIVIEYEP